MIKKGWMAGTIACVVFLAACGLSEADDYVDENYTFVDAVQNNKNTNDRALIYRVDKSVADVAAELMDVQEPEQVGEEVDGRQVLVYDDEFIILTEDPDNPGSTLVEVAEDEFVRTHYNPGFFTGMLLGSLLNGRFGSDWDRAQTNKCRQNNDACYSGGGAYGSFSSGSYGRGAVFRGGGPGTGK
ncbi:hypothetical protein BTO30_11660 [Domibacillus antri]|uniref:DUF4247 domain-containing protein n=1 Tax=Domibacillus antri TaxID=1714264 RepID=A0A1Q8Q3Y0_9BACI|nr:DUF4247 domain-containing protein [Domibacillus antri]OLN22066.1 hypothetical protein BTO30_11660 [Domibacillus antri]